MGNNVVMAPRTSLHVDHRNMVIVADKKRPFVDWEAALAGIPGGNTVPEYAANRDIFTKQKEVL